MWDVLGNLFIIIGLTFVLFGIFGVFRFNNFYSRILVASKVDTVGFITILTGVIIKKGFSFFSLKVILIMIIMLIINPLTTHSMARAAYRSGYKVKQEK